MFPKSNVTYNYLCSRMERIINCIIWIIHKANPMCAHNKFEQSVQLPTLSLFPSQSTNANILAVQYGDYAAHIKEALSRRQHGNFIMFSYEELKKDNIKEFQRLNSFLGIGLNEEQLKNVSNSYINKHILYIQVVPKKYIPILELI